MEYGRHYASKTDLLTVVIIKNITKYKLIEKQHKHSCMKKIILGLLFATMAPMMLAYAATPVLTVTGSDDNNTVTVRVTNGEINAQVVLFYNQNLSSQGNVQQNIIGTTDASGNFTGTVSTSALGISQVSPVYVQVGGYQSLPVNWPYSSTATSTNVVTFSSVNPTLTVGQSGTVTLSGGGGGTFFISSNSNPNMTTASISGNTLTLSSSQVGQTSVTVCSTAGSCAVVTPNFVNTGTTATTTGSVTGGTTGSPTISQSNIDISQGGQGSVTLSGGVTPYTFTVPSGSGLSTTLVGNTLYVSGNNATGVNTIQVCSANNAGCTPFTVTMQGTAATTTATTTTGGMLGINIPVTLGETLRLSLSGGSGTYYIQSPGTTQVTASVNGNILTVVGSAPGSTTVNVCSSSTSTVSMVSTTCLPITLTVSQALTGTGGGYLFTTTLSMGMSGQDVLELQNRLSDEGYFTSVPTGYFGPITEAAVRAYQTANGLPAVGIVGPLTRALLNQ